MMSSKSCMTLQNGTLEILTRYWGSNQKRSIIADIKMRQIRFKYE